MQTGAPLTLEPLLLFRRHLDSGTHTPLLHATVKVASESRKAFEREVCIRFAPGAQLPTGGAGSMANLAPPARLAVEGALYCGRYGINTDSHAAPQPDPRARREVSAHRARSRKICFLPVGVDRENV